MKYPPGKPLGIQKIIVHHSATSDTDTLSWTAIERFHTVDNGWDDIGYHAGCEFVRDGYMVMIGRPENRTGSHTKGENHDSLGFLFVGNYDERTPPQEMLEVAARRWFVPVMARYGLDENDIYPHNAFAKKTCPGKRFDLNYLKAAIERARNGVSEQ